MVVAADKDKRRPVSRRWASDLLCRRGRVEQTKVASLFGYGLLVYIMVRFPDKILASWEMLLVASCIMVFPSLVNKIVAGRFGAAKKG